MSFIENIKKLSGVALVNLILAAVAMYFLPWWSCLLVTGIVAFFYKIKPLGSFATGFATISLLWMSIAIYYNTINNSVLSNQIGGLFGGISGTMLTSITSFIGGLCGGLGAWSGSLLRKAIR